MTDSSQPDITVKANSTVVNPTLSAAAVLLSFLLGLMAKNGWITATDVMTLPPAIIMIGVAAWRAWVAWKNAHKAKALATSAPNAKVV
jgi:hypothetical protein